MHCRPHTLEHLKERFKEQLENMKHLLAEDFAKPENQMYNDEIWLLRFMMNPKYSVPQCVERYRVMMRMRHNDGVTQIYEELVEISTI